MKTQNLSADVLTRNQPRQRRVHVTGSSATLAITLVLLAGVALIPACGSSSKVDARSTTVGQELKDLEDARNRGLLTEDEYARKREEIMDRD